ncbi:Transducin/WD40 repeat-like superfamily protein, partial [Prunus dulcis]
LGLGLQNLYAKTLPFFWFSIVKFQSSVAQQSLSIHSVYCITGHFVFYKYETGLSKMGVKQDDGSIMPTSEQEKISDELDIRVKKFLRGEKTNLEGLQDKKLKGQLAVREELFGKSAQAAAKAEKWLLPSEGGYLEAEGIEKTWRIKQESIAHEVDILSARSQYDIVLPDLGPYTLDFTSSGRYMAAGGRKGHLAILDMKNMSLVKEIQEHGAVLRLQFLKNHFLLASINKSGQLRYQDVTMGGMVANYRTGLGRTDVMQVNPYNGVVALGHSLGTVSMWKPTSSTALLKRLCHKGPITAMAFHPNGHLMATAGKEKKIMLWDLRNLKDEPLQTLPGNADTLDFSQKGLLARSTSSFVQILRDSSGTQNYNNYMTHKIIKGYQVEKVLFRPYEDVLGIGHSMGWSSILIPGSGEPNFDSWVANPFETSKQRREREVHSLLDKLPPETIMLNPTKIGTVKPQRRKEKKTKEEKEADMEAAVEAVKGIEPKKKTKGRNKPSKRTKKKQEIVANAKRPFLEQQKKEEEQVARKKQKVIEQVELPTSLQRFSRKKSAT